MLSYRVGRSLCRHSLTVNALHSCRRTLRGNARCQHFSLAIISCVCHAFILTGCWFLLYGYITMHGKQNIKNNWTLPNIRANSREFARTHLCANTRQCCRQFCLHENVVCRQILRNQKQWVRAQKKIEFYKRTRRLKKNDQQSRNVMFGTKSMTVW